MQWPFFGLWVLQYSARQKAYHVSQVDEMLHKNWDAMLAPHGADWIVVGMGESRESLHFIQSRLDQYLESGDVRSLPMQPNNESA